MSPLLLHSNTNQYNIALYIHLDVSHTDMLQPHFISCRGVSGAGDIMSGSRNFCKFYLVLILFYSLQRGSNGFIAEKNIPILYQGSRGGPLFSRRGGGGVQLFQGGGVQMLISIETHIRTCYFPGACTDPLSPSGSAHRQCHHNGTIFIRVRLLTIIVRH